MYKCKICGKKYKDLSSLYNHIESKHSDMIPQDMSVQQYYYYMKTGRSNGNCVMCKQPTTWNINTNKYNRFCGNPNCKEKYVKIMKGRMIAKYGKAHLLNDPNKQREMLANRSISGTYEWSDGKHKSTYTGSYELDFLKTLDNFFDWDPEDISMPSPHTYTYEYEGERKFYIPDVFIHSLDLEIEIKDGGDNPNNHHKIQDVDKVKEKLKDEVLTSQRNFHYVKITNKNYSNFFDFLKEVKSGFEKYGDDKKIPRIFKTEDIRTKIDYVKESTEDFGIIEEKFEPDKFLIWFDKPIDKLLNRKIRLYHSSINNHSIKPDEWNVGDIIDPMSINTGVTKFSDVRLSLYFWDNPDYAEQWGVTRMLNYEVDEEYYYNSGTHLHKSVLSLPQGMTPDELLDHILKKKPSYTLYESETSVRKLEMGPVFNLKEYTVSEPVKILKKTRVEITKEMILKYCTIVNGDEFADYVNALQKEIVSNVKNFARGCLIFLVNGGRDKYRGFIWRDLVDGKIKNYKELANYKKRINKSLKANSDQLLEAMIYDTLEESFARNIAEKIDNYNKKSFRESDILLSLKYDLVKGSPKELQEFLLQLIKGAKYKDDLVYVNDLVGKSETYYYNLLKKRPEIKGEYQDYHNWTYTGMRKEMKDRLKKISESVEEFEFLEEKFEPDKFLVWFDKPVKKLLNKPISLYHATEYDKWNVGDIVEPKAIAPGATKFSIPRFAMYFWDNIDIAPQWGLYRVLRNYITEDVGKLSYPCNTEMKIFVRPNNKSKKELIDDIVRHRFYFYIYEINVDTNKLEIGAVKTIKEYTISEPVKIVNKRKVLVDKDLLMKWLYIATNDEEEKLYFSEWIKDYHSVRGLITPFIDSNRDNYRRVIGNDVASINKDDVDFKDYRRRINKSIKAGVTDRLLETPEAFELLEEKFEPDKFLVWFDKPVKKLIGGKLRIFHGSCVYIDDETIDPLSFNVGATKYSDPRWSTYFWDNKEDAMKWASAWAVSKHHRETLYIGHNGKTMLGKPNNLEDKEFAKDLINKMARIRFYVYECEVDIKDLEIGSCPSIKEYTVSKPVKILKTYEYALNKEILRRCFNILPVDEVIKFKEQHKGVKHLKLHRNIILNHVLDNTRDSYRSIMRTDLQQGNIKVGDDLSGYKDSINHHVKRDTYGLKESYIMDVIEESSISMVQLNLYLQNQYEEEMKHYLDTYKQYYEIMRREKPHAVKNLNEDIKRAIIFIDGLASKGVENNLVQFAREELGSIVNIPKRGNAVKIHEATNVKGNVWVGADWHFYKNKHGLNFKVNKHIDEILRNFNKHVKANDTFIFLGDLYDARSIFDMKMVPEIFRIKDLKGYKIMIKGNHDVNTNQFYLDLGFDEVYEHEYRLGNIVFSHEPVKVDDDEINIHGHIHFSNNYWDVKPINHLDAYIEHYNFKPVTVIQMIEEYRDTDKLSFKAINKFDKLTSIFESTDILNIKLIYENSNARSLFSLADTKSQLLVNNEFIVKRDKMGNHCSVSLLEEALNSENIVEFELNFENSIEYNKSLKENMSEGIFINSMFNFRDNEYNFIKETCLKLFGVYPTNITKK